MGLIKPTELGDSGVWASLLDAMFDLIDAHDHSAGKGLQIKQSNLKIDADIPWSSGGTFWAIKDVRAVDFQPSTQASVSTFAGALFVDSSNNELSYRTTGGSIIRFTNGATFNFAAIGAIGGDYTAAGALVDYVDANGLYRMRQELAAGAQQFAIVQTGGVDLFEFKLHPTVGVPANRVRLSSSAALGASYTITMPVLPSSTESLSITSAGVINTDGKHGIRTDSHHAVELTTTNGSYVKNGGGVGVLSGASSSAGLSISLRVGERILAVRANIIDSVTGPTKLNMIVASLTSTNVLSTIATSATSAGSGANQQLSVTGLTTTLVSNTSYLVIITITTGAAACGIYGVEVDYDQP
jgi:hypothetical protein